ncbi:MAG: 4Fe-4S dicluster domain-containing protein [Planctomycetota bacterium]|jgi:formate dehydrogenase iron-sulfur subunit
MEAQTSQTVSKRVLIDLDRCIECGSCAAACSVSHANVPAIQFARAGWALLPVVCRQCKAAPCVDTCPAEAMVRDDDGVVRRRLFRCVGCGCCVRACPFGVIPTRLAGTPRESRSPERLSGHQAAKCDLCRDRTAGADDGAEPRCVAACPSGALIFADERGGEQIGVSLLGGRTAGEHPFKRR